TQQSQDEIPQLDSGLAIPTFQQGEDLINCINKAMAFLSVVASRFPPSNNQLKTNRGIATTSSGNYAAGQAKIVKCYNCLGEGNMAKQCTSAKKAKKFCMVQGEVDVSLSTKS
ncbi:retrovirus-related pol polyprotein from transposon TNT 1-94, partial [Tanacetum coccineum]